MSSEIIVEDDVSSLASSPLSFHSCVDENCEEQNIAKTNHIDMEHAHVVNVRKPNVRKRVVFDESSDEDDEDGVAPVLQNVMKHQTPLGDRTNLKHLSNKPVQDLFDANIDGIKYIIAFPKRIDLIVDSPDILMAANTRRRLVASQSPENGRVETIRGHAAKDQASSRLAIKEIGLPKHVPVTKAVEEFKVDCCSEEQSAAAHSGTTTEHVEGLIYPTEEFIWTKQSKFWNISSPLNQFRLPASIGNTLFDYQQQGVSFILRVWCSRLHGGVLADDMGMGKTNQSVAALCALFASERACNALVITPLAVLDKWRAMMVAQISATGSHSVLVLHGNKKDAGWNSFLSRGKQGIILTTFETAQSRSESLSKVQWDVLIADEASKIKNYRSQLFKSLRIIASSSKRRLCITGTPFENSLQELWSVFDFACDGALFGPLEKFNRIFANRIERSQILGTSDHDKVLGTKLGHALSKAIQPFMIRREKAILQEALTMFNGRQDNKTTCLRSEENTNRSNTPSKTMSSSLSIAIDQATTPGTSRVTFDVRKVDLIVWTNLSETQRETYRMFLDSEEVSRALNQTQSPLAALTVLKKICDDVRLVKLSTSSQQAPSNKLKVLMSLIQDLAVDGGHKVIVFSHSKAMVTYIAEAIDAKFRKDVRYLRVDGDLKVQERIKRIKCFNRDEAKDESDEFEGKWDVLLLTSGIGALGIEVTGADRVVIFDPHWVCASTL